MHMTTKEMVEKLRDFSVPELCDGMEEPRVMDYQVKPLAAGRKIVGPAYTVDAPYGVSGIIPDALLEVKEGDVMVIAGKGECNHSYWGDHRSICAKLQGVEGVVIDGAFRDIEGCREAGVPIYAKAVIPQSCKKSAEGELNVTITCAGVKIPPGDLIVGDENGVCVIRPEEVESVIKKSEQKIKAQNETIDEMLKAGKILPRVIFKDKK